MSAPAAGTLLEGRYELRQPLGRGGMATVYRAHDRRLDRPVAVKLLDAPAAPHAGAAWREDRLTASLSHPHIVAVYDSGTAPDGRSYLVMELVEGQPLGRLAPLPPARALALAEQVADALAHAHARGIVHCDLTPRNVLVDAAGRARLTDFGVASAAAAPVGEVVYGTAAYLAPERLRGAPTSPAVDLYALGAVLAYLLTGQPPYPGRTPHEILSQVEAGPPVPLTARVPGLPRSVEAIVARALDPDPAGRYPTAEAFRQALADARDAAESPTAVPLAAPRTTPLAVTPDAPTRELDPAAAAGAAAPPPGPRQPAGAEIAARRRARWLLPAIALVVLALVVAGIVRGAGDRGAGAATIQVPDVTGASLGAAYRQLFDRGLVPGRVDIAPGPGQPANVVIYQEPAAGERVERGTAVNLVLRTAP